MMSAPKRERPTGRPPRPRRKLPVWKRWLFRAIAVCFPILAIEAVARIYWTQFVRPPKSDLVLYEEMLGSKVLGDEVPYQFHPNHEFLVAETPTRTNNLAIRGDEDIDLTVPYGGTRILCVGDSVTFGYTVSGNGAAYPAVLESLLRDAGIRCQVLNAGMPRFRIQHIAKMYHDHFRHYRADCVVVLGGWNNANDRVLLPTGERSWMSWLNANWYTLKLVRHWQILPQLGGAEHPPARIEAAGYADYADSLSTLIGLIRENGAQPLLCTLPHFFHHVENAAAAEKAATFTPVGTLAQLAEVADTMNATIRDVGKRLDVPVIDLSDIAASEQFGDAIHPNDEGSAAIARQVAQFLLESEIVQPAGARMSSSAGSRASVTLP